MICIEVEARSAENRTPWFAILSWSAALRCGSLCLRLMAPTVLEVGADLRAFTFFFIGFG